MLEKKERGAILILDEGFRKIKKTNCTNFREHVHEGIFIPNLVYHPFIQIAVWELDHWEVNKTKPKTTHTHSRKHQISEI